MEEVREEEEECRECKTKEEEIYWSHFRFLHFCQLLSSDFISHLMIPKKFSDNAGGKLGETVTLKGPSGAEWDVGLVATDDMLFLRDGWEEFVNSHTLQENDILIFKYNGNSHFDVMVFDRGSLCERESSFFIKKCGHGKTDNGFHRKRCLRENPAEVIQDLSHNDSESTPTKKPRNDGSDAVKPAAPSEQRITPQPYKVAVEKAPHLRVTPVNDTIKSQGSPVTLVEVNLLDAVANKSPRDHVGYVSNRRPLTEKEEAAVRKAFQESTDDSFIIVMRPTHLYRKHYLTVPAKWAETHCSPRKQDMVLCVGEKSWPTKLIFYRNGRAVIAKGWQEFVSDNCLKESDVCLFKPISSCENESVTLDVSIFRVASINVKPTEKETPLVVDLRSSEDGRLRKFFSGENRADVIQDLSHGDSDSTPPRKPRNNASDTVQPAAYSEQLIPPQFNRTGAAKASHLCSAPVNDTMRSRGSSATWVEAKLPPAAAEKSPKKDAKSYPFTYVSNRRPVTEEEKRATFRMASRELTDDSFMVVMRPSHVYRGFYLTVPVKWAWKHLSHRNQDLLFRVGENMWPARVKFREGGRVEIAKGWRELVSDNCLEEFDVCLFKPTSSHDKEPVTLDVRIFRVVPTVVNPTKEKLVSVADSRSFEDGELRKFFPGENPMKEVVKDLSDEDLEPTPSKEPRNATSGVVKPTAPSEQQTTPQVDRMDSENVPHVRVAPVNDRIGSQGSSVTSVEVQLPPAAAENSSKLDVRAYPFSYVTNRRPVTEEEKEATLRRASRELTDDSFIVVMRPTHVYQGFYLSPPSKWVMIHLSRRNQELLLRVGEKTWSTKLVFRWDGRAGITKGWKEFVIDNNLEEFDICVFKPACNHNQEPFILDVCIFWVVPAVEIPTRVKPPSAMVSRSSENGGLRKFFSGENDMEVIQDLSQDDLESTPTTKPRNDVIHSVKSAGSSKQQIKPQLDKTGAEKARHNSVASLNGTKRSSGSTVTYVEVKLPSAAAAKSTKKDGRSYPFTYVSNRRLVTEKEKTATLLMASRELSYDSFLVVMRATSVYRAFYLSVPANWIAKHLTNRHRDMQQHVTLRIGEDAWPARLIFRDKGRRGGIKKGWQEFVTDNCLEEFDVCVFKQATSHKPEDPLILDVKIFRVVPVVVRPTKEKLSSVIDSRRNFLSG